MIHLIVGNTGAGKTTYALKLQKENKGIIFSVDKWNKALFMPDMTENNGVDWFLERIRREEEVIKDLVLQLENAGTDSILDLGLSKFEHRQKFRDFAEIHDFQYTLHYLDVPSEIRRSRVLQRNEEKGESYEFEVSEENFEFMESWFEVPNENELENAIVITSKA